MNLQELGNRIRNQREKRHLKQIDIANALQISSQAVSKWERGENAPDIAILLKLSKILSVTTDWLLGGTSGNIDTFEATVLCTGINNFASKSISSSPRDIAAWANSIFFTITESIIKYDGIPVKYVGDGFLCFFTGLNHADRALKSAIHAKKIAKNNDLMITLNTGDIYLGSVGHPEYSQIDIIGETVNAAFLTLSWVSENCPSGIGITKKVHDLLNLKLPLIPHPPAQIKGLSGPILLYESNSDDVNLDHLD